ncbi:MAG: PH domain-containing protein [Actinomycetota bacterium]|nr:PH domain-containing protein [Rubrobacter sp.]MDQ3507230.1 PH domain-containing protein [Actinomycetota bacterium]
MGLPIVEAAAHANHIVGVYPDRVEIRSGWQGRSIEDIHLRDIATVATRGLINCTLTITTNKGRNIELKNMALPEARQVKNTIETQKQRAGLYE